jgi:hypothetical protein
VTDEAPELQERAEHLARAKEVALDAIAGHGPETAITTFLDALKRHKALRVHARFWALEWHNARAMVLPGGSAAVRGWIVGYRWPVDPGGQSALPPIDENC